MHSTNMDSTNRPFFNFSILDSFPVKVGLEVARDFSKAALAGGVSYCSARIAMGLGFINPFSCNPLVFVVAAIAPKIIFKSMDGIYALGCLAAGPRERAESSDYSQSDDRTNRFRQHIWTVIHKCEQIEEKIDSVSSRLFNIRSLKEIRMEEEKFENINLSLSQLDALSKVGFRLNTLEKTRKVFLNSLKLIGKDIASSVISWQVLTSQGFQWVGVPRLALLCSFAFIATLGTQILAEEEFFRDISRQSKLNSTKWIVKQFNPNQDCLNLKEKLAKMTELDLSACGTLDEFNFKRLMSLCPDLKELTLSEKQQRVMKDLNVVLERKIVIAIKDS